MEAILMQQQAMAPAGRRGGLGGSAGILPERIRLGVTRRATNRRGARVRAGPARAHLVVEKSKSAGRHGVDGGTGPVSLFVGLPADSVTECHEVSRMRAISAGLRALKLLGADGVELPVSWAIVQPDSADQFEWAGYLAVADMVRDAGLALRVSLNTHGSSLPGWVAADQDVLLADRSGNRREGCLSFAADELPVLGGWSPLQAYENLFRSFAAAFQDFFGSTITVVTVSLGPNGELRYPSYPPGINDDCYGGAGEFQCYDKYMLAQLKRHAESLGQPLWGLSGPHDAPRYHDGSPETCGFFKEHGGSWKTPYGDFFLSWYAGQLLGHGDRVLAAASRVFSDKPVELSAKVPFLQCSHGARSRSAEATAGLYNSDAKNVYSAIAEMFARHACTVIVPGIYACAGKRDNATWRELLADIKNACARHGSLLAGESKSLVMTQDSYFYRTLSSLVTAERTRPCHFTYQRMGAAFFSPEHWPMFVQFVRSVVCPEVDEDDLPGHADAGPAMSPGRAAPDNARLPQPV